MELPFTGDKNEMGTGIQFLLFICNSCKNISPYLLNFFYREINCWKKYKTYTYGNDWCVVKKKRLWFR